MDFVVNSNHSCEVSAHVLYHNYVVFKNVIQGGGLEDLTTCMAAGRQRVDTQLEGGGGGGQGERG